MRINWAGDWSDASENEEVSESEEPMDGQELMEKVARIAKAVDDANEDWIPYRLRNYPRAKKGVISFVYHNII